MTGFKRLHQQIRERRKREREAELAMCQTESDRQRMREMHEMNKSIKEIIEDLKEKTSVDQHSRLLRLYNFLNNQITDHNYWRRYWEGQALPILARESLEEDMRDNLDKIINYAHELAKGLEKLEFPDK